MNILLKVVKTAVVCSAVFCLMTRASLSATADTCSDMRADRHTDIKSIQTCSSQYFAPLLGRK